MKKLLALLLFTATCTFAQVVTLDFGSRGSLTIYLPGDWKIGSTDMAGQYTVTISPAKESVNASCTLTVTFPDVDRLDTKGRLKLRVDCRIYEEHSVEGKSYAKEFSLTTGYGYYCSFTDPDLRGKPPQPGNYKVISAGKIRVTPNVIVDVFMGADGFRDEPYQQLLGAIEGMEFKPGRGR